MRMILHLRFTGTIDHNMYKDIQLHVLSLTFLHKKLDYKPQSIMLYRQHFVQHIIIIVVVKFSGSVVVGVLYVAQLISQHMHAGIKLVHLVVIRKITIYSLLSSLQYAWSILVRRLQALTLLSHSNQH